MIKCRLCALLEIKLVICGVATKYPLQVDAEPVVLVGYTRTGDRQQAELQQVAVTTYNWDIFIILGLQDVAPAEEEGEVGQTELQPQVYFTKN